MGKVSRRLRVFSSILTIAVVATACGGIEPLTTEEALERLRVATTKVYSSDGQLIANLHGEINRDISSLDRIPDHVQDAVIAIEDQQFWTHRGLDLKAITRAAVRNASNGDGDIQGGSTISQQLTKNLYFPEPERTLARKLAEARLTVELENTYTKQEILERYLNTVYFGRGVYGIDTAADSYFRKEPEDLTVSEAAFLAGLIHEPGRYGWSGEDPPVLQERRKKSSLARRDEVLDRMVELESITRREAEAAMAEDLELEPPKASRWQHPYFVDYALRELGVLGKKGDAPLDPRFDFLGETYDERSKAVYRGGLRIYTTLDTNVQTYAERAIAEQLPEDLEKLSAALVAVQPGTGFVRALVGGRDYYPENCEVEAPELASRACRLGKVNLALGETAGGSGRQAGSAFKPFVLATALESGVSLRSSFSSSPFTHPIPNSAPWKVRNYEGSGGGGMSVVEATVKSVNAAYARLEIHGIGEGDALQGAGKVADVARRLGFSFPTAQQLEERCDPEDYNVIGSCTPAEHVPAIALGAKEVSPLEMAAAYATFANDGVYVRPTAITKITDGSGKVLYEADPEPERAIPEGVARGVTHVLEQVIQRGTGTRASIGRPAAGKTGTSQMWRDAWFVGYVPQLTAAVWVGNPIPVQDTDGTWGVESMIPRNGYPTRIAGGTLPAPIWGTFMRAALEDIPEEDFEPPPGEFFVPRRGFEDDDEEEEEETEPAATPVTDGHFDFEAFREQRGGGVPSVVGMSPAAARSTLSSHGYGGAGVRQCSPSHSGGLRVWRQSPGAGASAPQGSTVTFWYSPAVC